MSSTSSSSRSFIPYRRLGSNDFRLLRIRPLCFGNDLTCDVFHASLDDPLPFEALSYVWGSPDPPFFLRCAGAQARITKNLHDALCHFRHSTRSRIIWADAICINQSDNAEKATQVNRMREIYSKCEGLLIWFGAPTPGVAENVLKAMKRFRALFEKHTDAEMLPVLLVHHGAGRHMDAWEARVLGALDVNRVLDKYWKALAEFFGCPWFYRVWIVQDAISAPGGASPRMTLAYGGVEFDWLTVVIVSGSLCATRLVENVTRYMGDIDRNAFPWALLWMIEMERQTNYLQAGFDVRGDVSDATQFVENCTLQAATGSPGPLVGEASSLLRPDRTRLNINLTVSEAFEPGDNFLILVLRLNSRDPQDKIYALLGVLEQDVRLEPTLQPDYTKSTANLYTDVTLYFIDRERCLDILERTHDQLDQGTRVAGLPSWVVDWTQKSYLEPFHPTHADWGAGGTSLCGHSWTRDPPRLSSDGQRLGLKAYFAGVIQWHVPPTSEFDFSREDQFVATFNTNQRSLARDSVREFSRYRDCLVRAKTLETGLPPAVQLPDMAPPSKAVKYRITDESLYEASWRTLICDLDIHGQKPDSSYAEKFEAFRQFQDQWNGSEFVRDFLTVHNDAFNDYQQFLRRWDFYGRERRFFITSMKLMGWAPRRSQVGDHIVVFAGARLPYVVRWMEDAYELIGPAYVHGLMEFLGRGSAEDICSARASRIPMLNPACDIWLK